MRLARSEFVASYAGLFFSVATVATSFLWWWYLKKNPSTTSAPTLNRRGEHYLGRTVTLEEPIVSGRGRVRIDDGFWTVAGEDLPKGASVRVVAVEGTVLRVEKKH